MDKDVTRGSDLSIGLGQTENIGCDLSYSGLSFSEKNISQTQNTQN